MPKIQYKLDHIKFTKNAAWLMPFVQAAKSLVPIARIKHVKTYKAPKTKQDDTEGLIERNSKGNFDIRVKLYVHRYTIIHTEPLTLLYDESEARMLWFILSSLAHELAHTVHWDHDVYHYLLENRIMRRFAKVLRRKNTKDLYKRGKV